jgi:DNA-directed RNA polymerase specialized sigma24 family protein
VLLPVRKCQQKRKRSRARREGRDLSDIEIVDRLLRGEPRAFESFYQRYDRLIYHCTREQADEANVSDISQSSFERLVKSDYRVLRLWHQRSSLPIYLSKVIGNFVIDFHREKPRQEPAVGGQSELEIHEPKEALLPQPTSSPMYPGCQQTAFNSW